MLPAPRFTVVTITSFAGATEMMTNRIGVDLAATQSNGSTANFTGTDGVGAEGGRLQITGASITPAP